MANILKSLKNFITSHGGDVTKAKNIAAAIDELNNCQLGGGGALIVPFIHSSGDSYSAKSGMTNEILTALHEGRRVISSGLESDYNGPYEADMNNDETIYFRKIYMNYDNTLHYSYIEYDSTGDSTPLKRYTFTGTLN